MLLAQKDTLHSWDKPRVDVSRLASSVSLAKTPHMNKRDGKNETREKPGKRSRQSHSHIHTREKQEERRTVRIRANSSNSREEQLLFSVREKKRRKERDNTQLHMLYPPFPPIQLSKSSVSFYYTSCLFSHSS